MGLWQSEVIDTGFGAMTTISDPALDAATTTANVDQYTGIIITLTIAGNAQIIGAPTNTTAGKRFTVVNNDTSTDNIDVNGITLEPGEAQGYIWDGSAWIAIEAVDASDITFTPAGDIAATNIQDAIEELDTEKVAKLTDYSLMPDSHLTSHPAPTDRDTRNDPAGAASTVQGNLNTHTGNTTDAHGIDTKVDKVPGSSLVADTEIAKIHTQDTDQYLDKGGANEVSAAEIATLKNTTVPAKADKDTLHTIATASGATELDREDGSVFDVMATADISISYANFETVDGLVIYATNWGAHTITLPAGTEFGGGTGPEFTVAGTDIIVVTTKDGGTTTEFLVAEQDVKEAS
jgi:hypothetical protein